jgi:palmitoyltransferase ZDHHC13/17
MHDIFVRRALSEKVCEVNIVGYVNVVSLDMISTTTLYGKTNFSHCPWVNNCVGVRTHRSFVTYVTLLQIGIPMFLYLAYIRTRRLQSSLTADISSITLPVGAECKILPMDICEPLITDPYTTLLTFWTAIQLTWLTLLVVVQYYQITRGITTHELSNLQKYGFLGGGSVTAEDRMQEGVSSRLPPISRPDSKPPSRFQKCLRILGVEQFFTTIKDRRKRTVAQRRGMNPFDQGGCWTNCADFWAVPTHLNEESTRGWLESGLNIKGLGFRLGKGGEGKLGGEEVDYFEMWDVPQKRRKNRRIDEEYEAVAQVDEDVV